MHGLLKVLLYLLLRVKGNIGGFGEWIGVCWYGHKLKAYGLEAA